MSAMGLVKERLEELGISPNKKLGQNFLVSDVIIDRIVAAVAQTQAPFHLEVGPGLGALTEPLAKLGVPLRLIELDRTLAEFWTNRGMDVLREDALQVDWVALGLPQGSCFVSNLPYQISSSIVIDRSLGPDTISHMVLMFQKEVAQRIQSAPRTKSYGLLTVVAQTFWQIQTVTDAGAGAFFPPPQISSRVLKFERRATPLVDKKGYLTFVKAGFAMRRKQVGKALLDYSRQRWKLEPEVSLARMESLNLKPSQRAEEISVQQWQDLYQLLSQG